METKVMDFIVRLETRTRQLLLQYKALQEKCNDLQTKLAERENQILSLQNDQKELIQQYEQLKLAKYIDLADNDISHYASSRNGLSSENSFLHDNVD